MDMTVVMWDRRSVEMSSGRKCGEKRDRVNRGLKCGRANIEVVNFSHVTVSKT